MQSLSECSICGGEVIFLYDSASGRINKCLQCGSRFLDTQQQTSYDQDYYHSWFADPQQDIEKIKRVNFHHLLIGNLETLKGKKLLDVGCATGFLLQEAQSLGAEIFGVDVNDWAVRMAREKLPAALIYRGALADSITDGFFAPESFDIIVGTDVVEHVADVKSFFDDILRLMLPGGYGIFTLPDVESLSSRVLGSHWFQYKLEHVTFPTRKALALLADELGFTVERTMPHKKMLSMGFLCNVLRFRHSGIFNLLGSCGGAVVRWLWMSRNLFPIWTGEMLVLVQKNNANT